MEPTPRRPLIAGNWKMNRTVGEAVELAAEIKRRTAEYVGAEIVLCPPFTALKTVGDLVRYSPVRLGAQDVHWAPRGAFTGEISGEMLRDLGCEYVIVGHSERRIHMGETDAMVRGKLEAALAVGLRPIVCVGETLEEREAGGAEDVVRTQLEAAFAGLGPDAAGAVVAYEPVWAIGTGRAALPLEAQAAHAFLRRRLAELAGDEVSGRVRILYGGSVTPANVAPTLAQPDVDGGLVGGAALDPETFAFIVRAAAEPEAEV